MATSPATGKTGTLTIPYGQPANEAQWADDFLTFIGAPANKPNLQFITAAEMFEDVYYPNPDFIPRKYGADNRFNPLDSTQFEAGGVMWAENSGDPVWQFPTLKAGLESNAAVIEENKGDQGLLEDLRKGDKTAAELVADVGASDWGSGGGPGSTEEMSYSLDLSDELQDALSEVNSGLDTTRPAKLTGIDWSKLGIDAFGLTLPGVFYNEGSAEKTAAGDAGKALLSPFEKDLKAAWPYALMIVGIIGGVGLFILGAKKAATGKNEGSSGGVVNLVQEHPELVAAGA